MDFDALNLSDQCLGLVLDRVEGNIKKLFHDYGVEGLILITTSESPFLHLSGVHALTPTPRSQCAEYYGPRC